MPAYVNSSVSGVPELSIATYPPGSTPVASASGNVANATATATLAGAVGRTTYVTGFQITSAGATSAGVVTATLAGVIGGTIAYTYGTVAGTSAANPIFDVQFTNPLPASATNTAIVLTLPALGAGNLFTTISLQGFQI